MFDNKDCHDSFCILCWARETLDPLASLARGKLTIKGRAFKALASVERTFKVRYVAG